MARKRNSNPNGSSRKEGVSLLPQWTVRFPNDINRTLAKMKEELGYKNDSDVLKHVVTIYLAERRLIPQQTERGEP